MIKIIKKMNKGFTLIELLIAIFVFALVLAVGTSSLTTGFISGRLRSSSSRDLNRNLDIISSLIEEKMANSNAKVDLAGTTVYGFKILDPNRVVFAFDGGANKECTFLAYDSAKQMLFSLQETCGPNRPIDQINKPVSSSNLKITSFSFDSSRQYEGGAKFAPYLSVKITGKDTKTEAVTSLESVFALPYQTVVNFTP